MFYKFVWDKTKRRWQDKILQTTEFAGEHYLVKDGETPVIEVYIDENDLFKTYYCKYLEGCLAVRVRPQGLLGVQSWTLDTRLSDHAKDSSLREKYPNSPVTTDAQAHWNTEDSLFSLEELV